MTRFALACSLFAVGWLVGCAARRQLDFKPRVVIEFRGIVDGKCAIQSVQLDAKTGNQVVICAR